ncbi:MAG: TolC family protein [Fimbriimonadaceae bacterium]|nr:TolC family protein [Fimbriimonadaceae bacterium]
MAWTGFGLALGLLLAGQPTLTLEEAEKIAIDRAFNIRIAASNVEKALQQKKQLQGNLGPRLDLTGSYTRFDERSQVGASSTGDAILGSIDNKQIQASLSYPIDITGVLRKAVQAAELNRLASEESLRSEINDIKNIVRESYYEILRADNSLNVQQEALKNAQERLDKARQREQAGAIAKFDVLRFETDVSRAQAAVIAAQNRIRTAKNNLNNVLGRPIESDFSASQLPDAPSMQSTADDYVNAALRTRPDVKAADTTVQAFEKLLKTAGAGGLPSLSIGATHTYNPDPGFGGRQNQTVANLVLTFNVFDSGITRAKVDAAKQDLEQAKIRLEQIRLAASLQVRQALVKAENAKQTLEVALKTVEQQREALRLAQIRFDVGDGILLDVTDAQVALTQAQEAVITARFDYYSAYAALQKAVGADDLQKALAGGQN